MHERDIIHYLRGSASEREQKQLEDWIRASEENLRKFNEVKALYVAATFEETVSKVDTEEAYQRFRRNTRHSLPRRLPPIYKYIAAAAAVILLAVVFPALFDRQPEAQLTPVIVNNQITPGTNKAILTLEDGEQVFLEKGEEISTPNATSNGEELHYTANGSGVMAYNTLSVPRGGQFQLSLSDGTRVWLNSETQIRYPVSFIDGEIRQVELVHGEAYFDVSPSSENQGSEFMVLNNVQEVQVLGTEFNIRAYKDEPVIYTTLVEGKVDVVTADKSAILKPEQQARVDIRENTLEVAEVSVKEEIAWKNGEFIVKHKSLKEIMRTLSRWYDMDVTFANKELEEVKFVGILRKEQNIVEILNTIKNFNIIENYEINNKQLILK